MRNVHRLLCHPSPRKNMPYRISVCQWTPSPHRNRQIDFRPTWIAFIEATSFEGGHFFFFALADSRHYLNVLLSFSLSRYFTINSSKTLVEFLFPQFFSNFIPLCMECTELKQIRCDLAGAHTEKKFTTFLFSVSKNYCLTHIHKGI